MLITNTPMKLFATYKRMCIFSGNTKIVEEIHTVSLFCGGAGYPAERFHFIASQAKRIESILDILIKPSVFPVCNEVVFC